MDDKNDLVKTLLTGAMISIVAALVRALFTGKETLMQKIRTFTASVLLGTLVSFLLRNTSMDNFYKELLVACMSAFSATAWPMLELKFKKWLGNKDVVPDNNY